MTVMTPMTRLVNASTSFAISFWKLQKLQLLTVAVALVCYFTGPLFNPLFGMQEAASSLDSQPDMGTRFVQGHPDEIFVRELNQMGLHPLSLEMTLRRRSEIVPDSVSPAGTGPNGEVNARSRWGMMWMESAADEQVFHYASRVDDTDSLRDTLKKIDAFADQETTSPRYAWMVQKAAWCRWYLCRSIVAAHLATPAREILKEVALDEIRTALEQLDKVGSLAGTIPAGSRSPSGGANAGSPTATEVSSLIVESKLLGCDLLVLRAYLYGDLVEERVACGTQMLGLLDEVDKRIGLEFRAQSQIDLARARAWLFTGQFAKVIGVVQGYYQSNSKPNTPSGTMQHLAALASEACRLSNDPAQAAKWIESGGGWLAAPQLALEALTLELGQLTDGDEAGLASILEKKNTIGEKFGPYWSQRADAVLIAKRAQHTESSGSPSTVPSPQTASLSVLRTEVKQLLAGKQFEPAIEKLRQAETAAQRLKLSEDALGFAMQIGALAGIQKDFQRAAEEFQRASLEYSDAPSAPRSSMNAIAMAQEQIKALLKLSELAKSETDVAAVQDKIKRITDLRTEVWLKVIERWPGSDQGQSAAENLSHHYFSTDRVWEAAELWCGLWERLVDRENPSEVPASSSAYIEKVSQKSLATFRLVAFLRNQAPWDSNVLGVATDERWDALKVRLEKLCLHSKEHSDVFKSHLALASGYGWEFPAQGAAIVAQGQDRLQVWIDTHLALAQMLANPSDGETIKRLQGSLLVLDRTPKFASTANSHLASMVERSIRMMNLAWQAQMENAETTVSELQKIEGEQPKDPWWGYYAGRIYQTVLSQRERGLQRYVQLASSLRPGSEGWIECRARSIQILRLLGRTEEANKLANMVIALHSKLPVQWKNRMQAH